MASASQRKIAPLSVAAFRIWAESRPDEEHWELINGVPIMMAPPTHDHRRIASNLERLLNDAIERLPQPRLPQPHSPPMAAYQRIGVNLGPIVEDYDPEPDVAVVEVATTRDRRYADRFFLTPRSFHRATSLKSRASAKCTSAIPTANAFSSSGRIVTG
jgi:Uma2 family endonuclease